jgi:RNA polymerase sigma-70 factor, ECF subfamily
MHSSQPDGTSVDDSSANAGLDIQRLIDQYQLKIWRYLRILGCDETLADDLTQDTFVAVLRRPFEVVSDSATTVYLRRVAYHLLIDYRRKMKRVVLTPEVEQSHTLWTKWIGAEAEDEIFEYLKSCFGRLGDRAQLALTMRFRNNASREAIAEALAISPNGAKNLMQRAKTLLKDCIDTRIADNRQRDD